MMLKKKKTIYALISIFTVTVGMVSFLVVYLVIPSDIQIDDIAVSEHYIKGDPINLSIKFNISRSIVVIERIDLEIESLDYEFQTKASIFGPYTIDEEKNNLTISLDPLLSSTDGYFAFNVGIYKIGDITVQLENEGRLTFSNEQSFSIVNPQSIEQMKNNKFDNNLDGWTLGHRDERIDIEIDSNSPLDQNSLHVSDTEFIPSTNASWFSLSQHVNTTQTHFIEFHTLVQGKGTIDILLFLNNELIPMNLTLSESQKTTQSIFYGNSTGLTNITLVFFISETDTSFHFYLDNLSILKYEHRVFVVSMDNNWTSHNGEIVRNSTTHAIKEASIHFENQFGIKLIPILELQWDLQYEGVIGFGVNEIIKTDAQKLLRLNQPWDDPSGRSIKNNGFDLLACFSNRTAEHFGWVYLHTNVAIHFGQSKFLQDAIDEAGLGYIRITVLDEWAENLAQHEISHIFGADDRESTVYPPSVMTKAYSAAQAVTDFLAGTLWAQLNNWIIQDSLIILDNMAMFD